MNKLFVLVASEPSRDSFDLVATWRDKMPSQEAIDKIVKNLENKYESFALMQDILFIDGKAVAHHYDFGGF